MDNDADRRSLIPLPDSSLTNNAVGATRILSEMVEGTLAVVRLNEMSYGGMEQKGFPIEKVEEMKDLAHLLLRDGIDTPEKLARFLDEMSCGKARPYSEALWRTLGSVNMGLPESPVDWTSIYAQLDEETRRDSIAKSVTADSPKSVPDDDDVLEIGSVVEVGGQKLKVIHIDDEDVVTLEDNTRYAVKTVTDGELIYEELDAETLYWMSQVPHEPQAVQTSKLDGDSLPTPTSEESETRIALRLPQAEDGTINSTGPHETCDLDGTERQ